MSHDLIIIGAGMAGLSAGCYAQMNGYRSLILEAHAIPGGLCTAWKRKGYTFDASIHILFSSSSGMFHRMWRELGVLPGRGIVHHEVQTRLEAMGRSGEVFTDLDRLERELLRLSPGDAPLSRRLVSLARRCVDFGRGMPEKPRELWGALDYLKLMKSTLPRLAVLREGKQSLQGFAAQYRDPFAAELVRSIVDAPGWPMPEVPLLVALVLLAEQHARNAGSPLGGSIAFAQTIARRYKSLGGNLRCRARVKEILVERDRAVGVRLEDGSELRAGAVLSAADGRRTIFEMLGGVYASPELRRAYAEWRVYPPLVQVMLGVARDLSREPRHVVFEPSAPLLVAGEVRHRLDVLHYGHDPKMAPPGKSVVQVWYPSNHDYWAALREDRARYDAEKQRIAELTIAELDRRWPGFAAQVEVVDVPTPTTYERYTGNWQGSPEGWCLTTRNLGAELPQRLPGLARFYMAGQWTVPFSGVPGAASSGRNAIQLLCKDERRRFVTQAPRAAEPATPEFHDADA